MKKNINLNIPFYSQNNSLITTKGWERKICWLACIKMCIDFFNWKSLSLEELLKYRNKKYKFLNLNSWEEKEYKYYIKWTWWLHYGLLSIAKKYWLFWICEKIDVENITNYFQEQLENNICVITSVNLDFKNQNNKWGHLVIIKWIKYKEKWVTFIVNDSIQNNWNIEIESWKFIENFSWNIILISQTNQEKFSSNSPIFINQYPKNIKKDGVKTTYFHIHENERTALKESLKFIKKNSDWELFYIKQNWERFLRFTTVWEKWKKIFLRIDPNRIFSNSELKKTLIERNYHLDIKYLNDAILVSENIRKYIINKLNLDKERNYICVHTNKFLDINDFVWKCELININPTFSKNSFIIAPNKKYFQLIKKQWINVMYYSNENDWSLRNYLQSNWYKWFTIETWEKDQKTYKYLLEKLNSILNQNN